jgi:mono/diheme cytochrome c family protein
MRLLIMFILAVIVASACSPQSSTESNATLEPGNAERGAALFSEPIGGAPACSTCHTVDGSLLVGPTLLDYSEHAQEHAGDATIEEYTHASIVSPSDYVVSGFANVMFGQYDRFLSEQQIADLIAYLLTL